MRYVGITGFMSRGEVDACLAVLPEGLTLMCGVLVSAKTLRGERNKWWRRYPRPGDIAGIFSDDPRCLNLIHYSTGEQPPDGGLVCHLQDIGGPECVGFQFNGAWPEPWTLAALAGGHVVLQVRPNEMQSVGMVDGLARLRQALGALRHCRAHILIDGSGGRGLPIEPEVADAWGMTIRGHFGDEVGLGFAGGLDADYLPRLAAEVRSFGASIDAEGRLRDGDEGGVLNLEKAAAYLRAAGEVMAKEQG